MDPLLEQENPQDFVDPLAGMQAAGEYPLIDDDAIARRSHMYAMGGILDNTDTTYESLMDSLQRTTATTQQTILSIGESTLRQQAESEAMNQELSKYTNYLVGSPYNQEAELASMQGLQVSLQERAQRQAQEEAERKWAETLAALREQGDDSLAELMMMEKETPDVFNRFVDIHQTEALLMRAIEDAQVAQKDRNWFLWASDAAMYLTPFAQSLSHEGTFEIPQNQQNWWDALFSGNRFVKETTNFWDQALRTSSADERKALVDQVVKGVHNNVNTWLGPNEILRNQILSEYLNTPSAGWQDFWNALDWAPTGLTLGRPIITAPFKLTTTLIRSGNKLKAVELLEESMQALESAKGMENAALGQVGLKIDEVTENILPSAVNPTATKFADMSTGSVAHDHLEAGRTLIEELLGQMPIIQRLNTAEKAEVMKDFAARAERIGLKPGSSRKRQVLDVKMDTSVLLPGTEIHRVQFTIGKAGSKTEGWFYRTEDQAKDAIGKMGFVEKGPDNRGIAEAIEVNPGEWGIRLSLPVDETGKALGGARIFQPLKDKLKAGPFSIVARFVGSAKNSMSDELFGSGLLTEGKQNRIIEGINKTYLPVFYKVQGKDRDLLQSIMTRSNIEEKWYTPDELKVIYAHQNGTQADPTKFLAAYDAGVKINDMTYYLRNLEQLVGLDTQGYSQVWFQGMKSDGVAGKVYRNLLEMPGEVIYDIEKGLAYVQKPGSKAEFGEGTAPRLTPQQLKKYQDDGYLIVRTHAPQEIFVGGKKGMARYFLMKGSDLQQDKLNFIQVPYTEGGPRMYAGKHFVKMMRKGTQPWGDEYLDSPFTPTVAYTKAEAQIWAKGMNEVREAYNDLVKLKRADSTILREVQLAIDKLDDTYVNYPDADEFIKWMKDNGSDNPFEAVFDREMPSGYAAAKMQVPEEFWGEELSGLDTFMQTQGRMYLSSKGPVLKNIRDWDKPADVLDSYKSINVAMSQIARMGSVQDFKIKAIQKWISTYEHILNVRGLDNLNPMRIFLEAKYNDIKVAGSQAMIDAAELQRANIKRALGWKSEIDIRLENAQRTIQQYLIDKIGGGKPGKVTKALNATFDWVNEAKPLNAWTGFAYDMTLGFFNPRQWPLQVQTAFAASAIDIHKGGTAMLNSPAMLFFRRTAGNAKDLDWMIKQGWHKRFGYENPEDWRAMMNGYRNSGWGVNMLGAVKDEFGSNAAASMFTKGVHDITSAGRVIVENAEEINRAVAWSMAWRMIAENKKYRLLKVTDPQYIERVQSLASTLSANMDRMSAAAWQRNAFTRIPTQFWSWTARMHELMLPAALGGNKDLTGIQKLRFLMGQGFMYGVNGLPIIAPLAAIYAAQTGTKPDIKTLEGIAYRGFWDSILANGPLQADVGFSEAAGFAMQPANIVSEIFGMGRYGESSIADFAGGASSKIVGNFYASLYQLAADATLQFTGAGSPQMTERSFHEFARSISTINNAYKAYYILNQGRITNRQGETVMDGVPSQYALMALLGLNPEEMQEQTARMAWLNTRKDDVKKLADKIVAMRRDWQAAFSAGDYARSKELSLFIWEFRNKMVPSHLLQEVDRVAEMDDGHTSVIEGVTERVLELQHQDRLIEQNKKDN